MNPVAEDDGAVERRRGSEHACTPICIALILDRGAQWALASMSDVEFMAFARIAAVAKVAWSTQDSREWAEFKARLGAQAPRWAALGINAHWPPKIERRS